MPWKPKHPCRYPGCPKLTEERYCEEHKKLVNQQYDRYGRDPVAKKRYGSAWRKIRARFLAEHPLCEQCRKVSDCLCILFSNLSQENHQNCKDCAC
jgi:5-methylcytosine-specific restriction protein A